MWKSPRNQAVMRTQKDASGLFYDHSVAHYSFRHTLGKAFNNLLMVAMVDGSTIPSTFSWRK